MRNTRTMATSTDGDIDRVFMPLSSQPQMVLHVRSHLPDPQQPKIVTILAKVTGSVNQIQQRCMERPHACRSL